MQNDDQTFRLILIVGFLILIPIAAYHRIRSEMTRERLDRRQEGLFILVTLRPLGLAGMGGLVAYMINPAWMKWSSVALSPVLRWFGVGMGVVAGLLLTWTLRALGKNLTDTVVTRREPTLVTTGPYRWVRHPFYSSGALAFLANSLVAANWYLLLVVTLVLVLWVIRTRKEEENLLLRFGDDYRRYTERTGRFLPRIKRSR